MSTTTPPGPTTDRSTRGSPWAAGLAVFAGVSMVAIGINQVLMGLAALAEDEVFLVVPDYLYAFDLTTWGWFHLVLGVLLIVTGAAVVIGKAWARAAGIGLVVVNLVGHFLFVPYYPVWAVLLIAVDVAVIWGLARYQDDTF